MYVRVVITVDMVMLLMDFGPYGIIFMNTCVIIVAILLLIRNFGRYVIICDYVVITVVQIFPSFLTCV
jgi:hypothetical protein